MKRRAAGFSLVELLIVMVVIMILAAIAIPQYMSAIQRSHEAYAASYLRQVQTGEEAFRLEFHKYTGSFSQLRAYVSVQAAPPSFPGLDSPVAFAVPLPAGAFQGHSGSAPGHGGTPPGQGGTPPGQTGTPPGQGGTPPGQGGTPPGQGGTPPGQGGTPPGQGGTPPGQTGGTSGTTGTTAAASDTAVRSMYIFELTLLDDDHWQCTAQPVRDRLSNRFFFIDDTGVIRYQVGALATASSPAL